MSNDYSPEIVQALQIADMVPGAGKIARDLVQQLWGDSAHIAKRSLYWKTMAVNIRGEVVMKLADEKKSIGSDHWEGNAKDAYSEWIAELETQAGRIQDSLWQVGAQLDEARKAVDSMRSDLRGLAMWLIGVVAATVVTVTVEKKAAAAVAFAVWEFLQKLNEYYTTGKDKFSGPTTYIRDLRMLSKDLVYWKSGTTPGPIPNPVKIPRYAPELSLDDVGDWHKWGDADPKARK